MFFFSHRVPIFSCGRLVEMVSVLSRLPSANDRILFLENHCCIQEAAETLIAEGRYADAGHLLRKNGRFIEAAKFARHSKFAAECFLSVARCVQTRGAANEHSELIEGPAQTALELFQQCQDKNGEAQCILILAKLRKDSRDVQYACELFSRVKNICGELDASMVLVAFTENLSECDVSTTFLKPLRRLFNLVLALNKPQNSAAEVQSVEICETYFGLLRGDQADTRCAFVKSGCLFVSVIPYSSSEVKANRLVLDVATARWRISNYLCAQAATFAQQITENLAAAVNDNTVCRRFLLGMRCPGVRCELVHAPLSSEMFYRLYKTAFNLMHINAVVKTFVNEISRFDRKGQLTEQLLTIEVRDFRACRQFYDLVFPKMGQHVSFLSRELVKALRRHGMVKERLSNYAEFLWKTSRDVDRWQNSDRFIEVSRILHLVGHSSKVVILLSAEERDFVRKGEISDGMLEDGEDGRVRSFFRLFEDGRRMLHVYGDVLNSAFFFTRRFMSLIARRSSIPFPTLANTCAIFEQQVVSCLALFARLFTEYDYPVCLPESYFRVIDFWDALNTTERFPNLNGVVESSARRVPSFKGIRQVQRSLQHMARLASGEISRRFNIIDSAFSLNAMDRLISGETERVLVLALTMLCNYGRGIPHPCSNIIERLRSVSVHPFLPSRLQRALEGVRNAEGARDVAVTLQRLLSERGERLFSVRWYNRKLWWDELNLTSFTHLFNFESNSSHPFSDSTEPPLDMDTPSEFQMPSEYLEEQQREQVLEARREGAAVAIQRWFRTVVATHKAERLLHESASRREATENLPPSLEVQFEQFKLDRSACSICGVHFSDANEMDFQCERESYSFHVNPHSTHWKTMEEFNGYKRLYVHKFLPLRVAAQQLRGELNALSGQSKLGSHDFGLDLQRLEHVSARVTEVIQDIESHCRWSGTIRLSRELDAFRETIQEVQSIVRQGK